MLAVSALVCVFLLEWMMGGGMRGEVVFGCIWKFSGYVKILVPFYGKWYFESMAYGLGILFG